MTEPVSPSEPRTKPALRAKMRRMRRAVSSRQRLQYDQAIRQHLLTLIESKAISSLAAYWPFDGEPDIIPLCRQLLDRGIGVALPKIASSDISMEFHAWRPDQVLEKNRLGIPEPVNAEKISLTDCPLLIMPLVAYDHRGNRLGVGAGYYDRHLESMRHSPAPLRIGIAYSLQETERLDNNDWDVPLHGVITENGRFMF